MENRKYGIVDIGSNTIVLIVYTMENGMPKRLFHKSTPTHLIDYVDQNKVMSQDGIQAATKVLQKYESKLDEMDVSFRYVDITEPCRIQNLDALLTSLRTTSFHICPLTGEQEASYDFIGAKLSYPDIQDGIAFDVGGGSSELIAFENNKMQQAMSFPLGCVRLSHLPLDTDACAQAIIQAQKDYPSLHKTSDILIGIGGSMRAIGLLMDEIYHTNETIPVYLLQETYEKLLDNDDTYITAMHKTVDASRIPVLLPGFHMILEIVRIYQANTIYISSTGIREGFLLHCIEQEKNHE